MHKFLCLLGIHAWKYPPPREDGTMQRRCPVCEKVQNSEIEFIPKERWR